MDTGQRQMLWVTWVNTNTDNPTHTNTLFFLSSPGLRRKLLRSLLCNTSYSVRYISKKKESNENENVICFLFLNTQNKQHRCRLSGSLLSGRSGVWCLLWIWASWTHITIRRFRDCKGSCGACSRRIENRDIPLTLTPHMDIQTHTHTHRHTLCLCQPVYPNQMADA